MLRVAFLASSALEWVSTFAIGMVAMYVGATLLITDLAGAGALAAVLASGAGLGARPLPAAVLAFAALLTLTMFEIAAPLAAAGPRRAGHAAWRRLAETSGLAAQSPWSGPAPGQRSCWTRWPWPSWPATFPPATALGPGGEGLSGGQRRRLAVAQAYLRRPGLLLLDEPTEGLDRDTARTLLENLRSALPMTTIAAAIHDRTLHHLPVPADVTIRLAAGQVLRATRRLLTGGSTTVRSG